jgi:hypothetical protein
VFPPKKAFFKTVCPESALISGGRPLIVSNSRLVDQLRNFHRFLQLYKFLVAAPERDAEITGVPCHSAGNRNQKEEATMSTQTLSKSQEGQTLEKKVQELRQLYANAPQFAKTALENTLRDLASAASQPRSRMESAGRTGSRQGRSRS